jgi:hypothetical protein
MAIPQKIDPFLGTFGLPPSTWLSDEMIMNSMPVLEIIPCKPQFESGLNLFSVEDDSTTYLKILAKHGFTTSTPIRAAFLADNFPTDSFTNDYGETFLQKFTDVASQGVSQLIQMTGQRDLTGAMQSMGSFTKEAGEGFGDGMIGDVLKQGGSGMQSIGSSLQNFQKNMSQQGGFNGMIGGGAQLINKMLGGSRVDFPQVWRNSGFTPSYTATIRLYNPNPGSEKSTLKYIVGPLAVFLSLALPRTDDGRAYNWPFFHKVSATGIYNLDPAVITNITVVKGGDQQQISYNQKLAMVDVRIDFASLYTSILLEEGDTPLTNRPTLRSYLEQLSKDDKKLYTKRSALRKIVGARAGSILSAEENTQISSEQDDAVALRNAAVSNRIASKVDESPVGNRVTTSNAEKQKKLENEGPNFATG